MGVDAWITLTVLACMFIALAREYLAPDAVLLSALFVLWGSGIVSTQEAFEGFSNAQVLTVALLFIVAAAMQETGALRAVSALMLGQHKERKQVLARLLFPTAGLSAFLNNTPIVAMFIPSVRDWALKNGRAPSRFLIPLSYAAILGGTCTLIGTSTNLVVSGLLESRGHEPFSMFELSPVGLPATVLGILFLLLFSRFLLPDRRTPDQTAGTATREYGFTLRVGPACPLIGKGVEEAGLRRLESVFLVAIERGGRRIAPVRPTQRIRAEDRLVLFGDASGIVELQRIEDLNPVDRDSAEAALTNEDRHLFEVVLSETSPLVGVSLRDTSFRRRYDAAVIAIHRGGERLEESLGQVVLRSGDTLMVEASPGFRAAWANSSDFYLVADMPDTALPNYRKSRLALLLLVGMVALMSSGVVSTLMAVLLAALLLLHTRCVSPASARRSVDLSVIVVIAASFGLSAAVVNSGVAGLVADSLISLLGDYRPWLVLAAIYLLTVLFTELLSNNAAAALAFPLALTTAEALGRDPRPYAVVVAVAASMSFITPLGYQTNLMVYGPGGYRFTDYLRIGIPMSLLCFIVAMLVVPWFWGW